MKRRINYKILVLIVVILTLGLLNGCGHKSAKKSSAETTNESVSSSSLSKASSDKKASEDALTEKQEESCSSVSENTRTDSNENQTTEAMSSYNDTVSGNTASDSSVAGSTYNNPVSSGSTYSTTQPNTSNNNHSRNTSGSATSSSNNKSTTSNTYTPVTGSSTKPPVTTPMPQTTTAAATTNTTTGQQNAQINVTISISCSTAVNNPELKPGISLPSDGIILSTCSVTVNKGDTVYAAFEKACSNSGIKYEFTGTVPMKSIYISSIAGLAQMDCGRYSGWKYSVNGKEPSVGCSMYTLSDGDVIDWHYTTTL